METMRNTDNEQHTELFVMLESFLQHDDSCPVRGNHLAERRLQNMWKLGFVDGSTSILSVILNRMCKPGHPPYTHEVIRSDVVMPLMMSRNLAAAERKVQQMIAATWVAA